MYTAVVTKITGTEQETAEYPVRNHKAFTDLTYDLFPKNRYRISVCPYDEIHVSTQRGVYWFATLHRNEEPGHA
jgi:hypothetical protein